MADVLSQQQRLHPDARAVDLPALARQQAERRPAGRARGSWSSPGSPTGVRGSVRRFGAASPPKTVADALQEAGAVILDGVVAGALVDRVAAELQPHLDSVGRDDEGDFNGYRTRRVYEVLARAPATAELIAVPRLTAVIDEVLLPFCASYRIGSCSAIEIASGERAQVLHRDGAIYPLALAGAELQVSALWALTDFTEENGATRVVPGSNGEPLTALELPRRSRGSPYDQAGSHGRCSHFHSRRYNP
jgi:hypothetical protein